jgi:phosphatidate phosphatase APP1
MPAAYAAWAREGATTFHYVSSSPWQLYVPLSTFASSVGFPDGAYHLKAFRLAGTSLLNLFTSSLEIKLPAIRRILDRFPDHTFLLVGDSGEKDPEIYGLLAREHPGRVRHVFIRRVECADNRPERFAEAFRGLPKTLWTVFENPADLSLSFATPPTR